MRASDPEEGRMRGIRYLALLIVIGIVAVACSNGPSAQTVAFCDAVVTAEAAFSGDPDPATIEGILGDVESSAPDDVADAALTITGTARSVLETGDFDLFSSEEFIAAETTVDAYMVAECGYDNVDVEAIDYAFTGVPESLAAGTYAFGFANGGTEAHEMAVLRVNDGVDMELADILALSEEEAGELITFVGGTFAMPGESATTFVPLDEGSYAAICFVPQGATPDNIEALESGEFEGGPPHFTLGMVSEFSVGDG